MGIKLVRKWEDKNTKYGIDIAGNLYLQCKLCNQTMTCYDISFRDLGKKKVLKYACSVCGKNKIVTL